MPTAYTPILQLALPVTGELQGVWGTVVNDNITSMIEQAIAGLATINTWTTASHTLTTANGTTDEARCAVLECSGAPGAAATVICPASTKLYVIKNSVTGGYAVTLKTSAGTGISVPNGATALLYCDGTNVVSGATYMATVSTTQVDILAQGDLRLQDSTGGEYVALQAPATLAASYTLTMPVDDGTAGQALVTDGNGVLSWSTAASGDVYGPASATDNAVARYDGTTGKIIQNSAVTIADDGATVIDVNSTSAGLRITQVGTGNALLVEDSANPDATPTIIDNSGRVLVGVDASRTLSPSYIPNLQIEGTTFVASSQSITLNINTAASPTLWFAKSRGATNGSNTIVSANDALGVISFNGADGTDIQSIAAQITASVDGTPGADDMPGRLVFSTTADGASSVTERMRIDSAGQVGIGAASTTGVNLFVGKNVTGATTSVSVLAQSTIQSDVTTSAFMFRSRPSTAAAAFTLPNLIHYAALQNTIGATSTVTNQFGFQADSSLTGATNNYGFYSNIASGTGRYNFYAAGTAENFFGGNTTISVTDNTNAALRITQLGTGNALLVEDSTNPDATPTVITADGTVIRGYTSPVVTDNYVGTQGTPLIQTHANATTASGLASFVWESTAASPAPSVILSRSRSATIGSFSSVASGDAIGAINFNGDDGTAFVVGASITASVDGTPGTSDMPGRLVFSTTADGASSPTERMRIDNAGRVGIGGTPTASYSVFNAKAMTGATTEIGYGLVSTIQSDVTTLASGYRSNLTTQATAFTLANLYHYEAAQTAFGAGSTVTNQYGFVVGTTLTGATNNYGFYSAIPSSANRFNFYAAGTAANVFVGTTSLGGVVGSESLRVTPIASAVNYWNLFGNTTAGGVRFLTEGSDTDVNAVIGTKGAGIILFRTDGGLTDQFRIAHTASAVNYLQVTGSAGTTPTLSAQGSGANLDIALTPKGTGVLSFGTYTAGVIAQAGYITIKDAGGTTRRLLVG